MLSAKFHKGTSKIEFWVHFGPLLDTFLNTFFEMGTYIIVSLIWVGFGLNLGRLFGVKIAKSCKEKSIEKQTCKKVTQEEKRSCGNPPPSPNRTLPGLPTGQGIRDTPLVPSGTVADFYSYILLFL